MPLGGARLGRIAFDEWLRRFKHGRRRRINIRLGHSLRQSALARPGAVTGAPLVLSSKQHPVLEPLGRATNLTAVRK